MKPFTIFLLLLVTCSHLYEPASVHCMAPTTPLARLDSLEYRTAKDSVLQDKIIAFAKTQLGVPYLYCSNDPAHGFDCSGFVNYVFNHFQIAVPRSSIACTNVGRKVALADAKPSDLILFTGTDPGKSVVGHIGIVISNSQSQVMFIHSSSGAAHSVTISLLDKYYMSRFVKVMRIIE